MQAHRIGFVITAFFSFLTPAFATQCPSADKVTSCSGGQCSIQHLSGWRASIFYTDQGKPISFLKSNIQGSTLNCYYAYVNEQNHGARPPAFVLRTSIN